MKIAFLFTQLEIGGAQTRVMQTAEELRSRGHTVDVYAFYQARPCFHDQEKVILAASKRPVQIFLGIVRLWSSIRNGKYDVFISNTAPANIIGNVVALLAGQSNRISWQTQPPSRVSKILRILDHAWGTIGVYSITVANSGWTRSCFSHHRASYLGRMRTILNGMTPRVDTRSKPAARSELGIAIDERVIVTVGRLSKQKGQDTLIRALRFIGGAKLYIIGDGELRQELTDLAAQEGVTDRVVFVGEVPGETVASFLRAGDIFAFPSRWETFGLAVVEASASGIPIVSSDLDVLKEVLSLEDGEFAASFFPVDDPVKLAEQIETVLRNTNVAQSMSDLSIRLSGRHSLGRHVDKILELIAELDSRRKTSGKSTVQENLKHVYPDMKTNPESLRRALVDLVARRSPGGVEYWLHGKGEAGTIPLQDHADIVYTFCLLGMGNQLSQVAAENFGHFLAELRLFGRSGGSLPVGGKPVNAHLTAYLLGAVRLLTQHTKLVPPRALYHGWQRHLLVDKRNVPIWPWVWTHHIWRVSHWIGGIPSILLHLARSGMVTWATEDLVEDVLSSSEKHLIDHKTGLLRPYRLKIMQSIFRQLYKIRHDPDLGDLGGVVHILWLYHVLDRPYVGSRSLRKAAERELARKKPFMENVPYCLDFDVLQLARTAASEVPLPVEGRAREFVRDCVSFFSEEVDSKYGLHKIPGALASMHECAWLTGDVRVPGLDVPRVDIIKQAFWL